MYSVENLSRGWLRNYDSFEAALRSFRLYANKGCEVYLWHNNHILTSANDF